MFDALLNTFQGSPLSLWGPFGMLLLCGLGVPVPEDIVLIAAGALGEMEGRSWLQVSGVMYAGVVAGDSMIFFAGRYVGARLLASAWMRRILPVNKQAKVENVLTRFGTMGLFVGRFLPGLRAPIFFTAGSMKVSYLKFLCLDGLAALVSVPLFVWLGRWLWVEFEDNLEAMHEVLERTHTYSLWLAVFVLAAGLAALWVWSRRTRKVT
ncbi:MAG: DedA family protein [Opitutaceae bacterium]